MANLVFTDSAAPRLVIGSYQMQVGIPSGNVVTAAPTMKQLALMPKPGPIYQRPRPFPGLLNRQNEVKTALAALQSGQTVLISGSEGIGKTTLLRHLAYHPDVGSYPDGVIYISAAQRPLDELLQLLFDVFFERPADVKATPEQIRRAMAGKQALLLLDDLGLPNIEVMTLLRSVPGCTVVLTSTHPIQLDSGRHIPLIGLPPQDAMKLLERELQSQGQPLGEREAGMGQTLCTALDGHPLAILQMAALARTPGYTLERVAQLAQQNALPSALARHLMQPLSEAEKRILSVLASLSGAPLSVEHLSVLSDLADPGPVIDSLRRRHLVRTGETHSSVSDTLVEAVQQVTDLTPWLRRTVNYFLNWTDQYRDDTERIIHNDDAILQVLWWCVRNERWPEVVRLGLNVERGLALAGHWDTWSQALNWQLQAAKVLKNRAAEAWVLHQLGIRALCLDNITTARNHLIQALRDREALGDQQDIAATKNTLNFLLQSAQLKQAQAPTRVMGTPTSYEGRRGQPQAQPAYAMPPGREPNPAYELEATTPIQANTQTTQRALTGGLIALIFGGAFILISLLVVGAVIFFSIPRPGDPPTPVAFAPQEAIRPVPSGVDFGNQPVSAGSVTQNINLSNVSPISITLQSALFGPDANTSFQIVGNTCTDLILPPASQCDITILFAPQSTGDREAGLQIIVYPLNTIPVTGGLPEENPRQIVLRGRGTAPELEIRPGEIQFGEHDLAQPSSAQNVTIANNGTGSLFISGVAIVGNHPSDFVRLSDECTGATIAPGAACSISLSFVPSQSGSRNANLIITTNASEEPRTIPLQGIGLAGTPVVLFEPATVTFEDQPVNSPSQVRSITVQNNGQGDLQINSTTLTGDHQGDFLITTNTCPNAPIGSNGSCRIDLVFAPTSAGSRTAQLIINHNGENSPQQIPLSGNAIGAPQISLSIGSISFPQQNLNTNSNEERLTISNNGTGDLQIGSTQLEGEHATDFLLTINTCANAIVLPTQSCTLGITFRPAGIGNRRATITVNSNAPDSPHQISLSGVGIGAPGVSLSRSNINFGSQRLGNSSPEETVNLTNVGSSNLTISGVNLSGDNPGDFLITNNTCGNATLVPNDQCLVGVAFRPTSNGSRTAQLVISHNAGSVPERITLVGEGITDSTPTPSPTPTMTPTPTTTPTPQPGDPGIAILTNTLTFAAIEIDSFAVNTLVITSTGDADLAITDTDLEGANSNQFAVVANSCPSNANDGLEDGDTCELQIRFQPTVTGTLTAQLEIEHNATGSPTIVQLRGEAVEP